MLTITDAILNKYVVPVFETYGEDEFASRVIYPRSPVGSKKYAYREQTSEGRKIVNTKAGERGKAARLDSGQKWDSGTTTRHFGSMFVPGPVMDEMSAQGIGSYLTEETESAKTTMMLEEEFDLSTILTAHATFTNKMSPGTKWNASGGDMLLDVVSKHATVKLAAGGHRADLLVLTEAAYLNALVLYRSQDGFGMLPTDEALANLFRVKKVFVAGCTYDSAKKGQSESTAFMWNQNDAANGAAWLIYAGAGTGRTGKGLGSTFVYQYKGKDVLLDRDVLKNPRGVDILVEMEYDQKKKHETSCYMFYNVLG